LDFLENAALLAGRVRVTLAGDGEFREEVERRTAASTLLAQLLHTQPWSDTLATLMQHDVLLLPSRFEGVPLVMLEAMALGVPVVASDLPGTRAYLDADNLFPVADLSRGFDIALSTQDSTRRRAIVQRNREAFEARASGHAFSTSVTALTEQLLRIGEPV
jgi:glycosyltransferase involved in cell wall biosynthesis